MLKTNLAKLMHRFAADESGAAAIEYAILAALIAMVIIGGVTTVGTHLGDVFNNISNKLT
jgi:pilus assembly protein Flp/PilA